MKNDNELSEYTEDEINMVRGHGMKAYRDGALLKNNPYIPDSSLGKAWAKGWNEEKDKQWQLKLD